MSRIMPSEIQKRCIHFIFMLGLLCLSARGQEPFMANYKKGIEAMNKEDYREAIRNFEQAISEHPESSESVRTYGVQFEPYHPYTYLAEAHIWLGSNLPGSFEKAKYYMDLAYQYGENDPQRFPKLKNKPQSLRNILNLILKQKDQPKKPEIPMGSVSELVKEGKFSEALNQVRILNHTFPGESLLETWKVILEEINAKTGSAQKSEQEHQDNLKRYLNKAREHVNHGEPQNAYQTYLLVKELDPKNKEAGAFIDEFTRQLELQGKSQEEIELELDSYITQNRDLLEQLSKQRLQNGQIQNELSALKKQMSDLQKKNQAPEPGLDVAWSLLPVPNQDRTYHINTIVTSQTPLKTLKLFIDGSLIKTWEIKGLLEFKMPSIPNYTFLNYENVLKMEGEDTLGNVVNDTFTHNIPKIRNPFLESLPKLVLFFLLFSISYFYLSMQRRKRLAFRERFNPYIAGAPVFSSSMFYGRHDLVKQILNTLHNNSMMICGERRIGKTSFLHRLKTMLHEIQDPEFDFYPVMIDLQGVEEEHFFTYLDHEIMESMKENGIDAIDFTEEELDVRGFTRRLRELITELKRVKSGSPKLVLLLDEVDIMNRFSEKTNQQLRSVFMKGFAKHLVAVMAGIHIKKRWESEGSPWYNFFEQIELEPFTERHARALIEIPVKGIYKYSEDAIAQILSLSKMKPYLIQRICVNLVAHILTDNRRRITKKDVDHIFNSLHKEQQG